MVCALSALFSFVFLVACYGASHYVGWHVHSLGLLNFFFILVWKSGVGHYYCPDVHLVGRVVNDIQSTQALKEIKMWTSDAQELCSSPDHEEVYCIQY